MLIRTHVAITVLAILLLINHVADKALFVIIALIAGVIPDIDTAKSRVGKSILLRPLQFFVQHRGLIHSFTFLFIIIVLLALFYPVAALPFFVGYGLHLFFDGFTIDGIRPFYPWNANTRGPIRTGGKIDTLLFFILIFAIVFLFIFRITNLF